MGPQKTESPGKKNAGGFTTAGFTADGNPTTDGYSDKKTERCATDGF
jgi:hypothetical protein